MYHFRERGAGVLDGRGGANAARIEKSERAKSVNGYSARPPQQRTVQRWLETRDLRGFGRTLAAPVSVSGPSKVD